MQTRPDVCILQCATRSKLEEVRKISVEEDSLRAQVSVFWTRPSTEGVTKLVKIISLPRKINIESENARSSHELRQSHISSAEFGLYNKYKEINFAPISKNRISGNGDRFNQNDFLNDTREGNKSCQNLSELSQGSFSNSFGIDHGYRSPIFHNTSSGTCKYSVKISSTTTNCVPKEKN